MNSPEVQETARKALDFWTGLRGSDETETDITDLIADLLIVADQQFGLDMERITRLALMHAQGDLDPNDAFYVEAESS